jgi:hypothetical protein
MVFSKLRLFLLLGLLAVGPIMSFKFWWVLHSSRAKGVYSFAGHGEAGEQVRLDYSICWYLHGKDTIWFNGEGNLPFHEGDSIPVRYRVDDPGDVRIDIFNVIWGSTIVYAGIPVFMLLAMYLHPKVVPRGRRVRVVWRRPFLLLD